MQISGERASEAVHELRARSDAILVGINTVLADDPMLTARTKQRMYMRGSAGALREMTSQLHSRIVLDSNLRIPLESKLVKTAGEMDVTIYFDAAALGGNAQKMKALMTAGVQLKARHAGVHGRLLLPEILADIAKDDVTHLLVEPGPTLARGFFEANAADRVWVIRSSKRVEDGSAPAAAKVPEHFVKTGEMELGGDVLTEYLNRESPVYFAPEPSADLVLRRSVGF